MSKTENLNAQHEYQNINNGKLDMRQLVQKYLGFVYDATNKEHAKTQENEESRLEKWHDEIKERKEIEKQLEIARAEA